MWYPRPSSKKIQSIPSSSGVVYQSRLLKKYGGSCKVILIQSTTALLIFCKLSYNASLLVRDESCLPEAISGHSRHKNSRTRRLLVSNGASNQDRTDDPRFTRAVLYQLSYAGVQKRANNYTGKPCIIQAEILKKPENTTNKALKIICVLLGCLLNTLMRSSVSTSWVCCKR